MNTMTSEVEILTIARDKIIRDGWVKRMYGNTGGAGPVCAAGALIFADASTAPQPSDEYPLIRDKKYWEQYDAHWRTVERAKRFFTDIVGGSIPYWNDRRWRTKKSVLKAFDTAIERAKKSS
jgi:hypothetical protein